ncbi:MAG TPA: very short patch repair endonuclease [Acidimicrobiia bacterium]|nr:very short patch repair endonuclease [Acidimicrobiia bacterium]
MPARDTPPPSSQEVAARMRVTRQKDTPAELALRRELHRRGLRYRVDSSASSATRARPDLSFPTERIAIFIDGCFWHSCPEHTTRPAANREWWEKKLAANIERDRRHDRELEATGWLVLRFWEHEDAINAADRVQAAVLSRRH